jgi:hypothetical protein
MSRFARQIRVIGREGQKKLEQKVAVVPKGFVGEIARRYLEGAGMRVELGRETAEMAPRGELFEDMHPAARDVAVGASMAVRMIMVAVDE